MMPPIEWILAYFVVGVLTAFVTVASLLSSERQVVLRDFLAAVAGGLMWPVFIPTWVCHWIADNIDKPIITLKPKEQDDE